MKFSENELRSWVNPAISTEQLAEQLTALGFEVEELEKAAPDFEGVIVGHVLTCEKHPDADRLRVCTVDVGESVPLNIVCGASNVRQGLKVAVIRVGGLLPDGTRIKAAKLRGVPSEGMICSMRELGLGVDHDGILELASDTPIGVDFRQHFSLNDTIVTINVTHNRGDCLSVMGIAREVAAKNQMLMKAPFGSLKDDHTISDQLQVSVQDQQACPRYVGQIIRGINSTAKSPFWLQEQLRRTGLRSIHPVVDVMNYVMLELGQPLHAFDLGKINGSIVVRYAKEGESIRLLDGQTLSLLPSHLVIADEHQPLALAGVMGGLDSGVNETTSDVFLESAYFLPTAISRTARPLGMHTDAAFRFERGVDPTLQKQALLRATALLQSIVGGDAGPVIELTSLTSQFPEIHFRETSIQQILGISLEKTWVETTLQALGFGIKPVSDGWMMTAPTWRFDVSLEVDLIEELARFHGYEHLPFQSLQGPLTGPVNREERRSAQELMSALLNRGYREVVTYSFVSESLERLLNPHHHPILLQNPLSAEMGVMRSGLWAGLLEALQHNVRRQAARVRLFEIGRTFVSEGDSWIQPQKIGGIIWGDAYPLQWGLSQRPVDFYDVKADVLALLPKSGEWIWRVGDHPALHPGQSASLYHQDSCVGCVGALHPEIVAKLDLPSVPFLFELHLEPLLTCQLPRYQAIPRYPSMRRDLALVVDEVVTGDQLLQKIREFGGHLLNNAEIFDIYQGESVGIQKKSIALTMVFQDREGTLTDEIVNHHVERVVKGLENSLQATLRI